MYKFLKQGTNFLEMAKRVSFKQKLPIVGSYIKILLDGVLKRCKVLYTNKTFAKLLDGSTIISKDLDQEDWLQDRDSIRSIYLDGSGVVSDPSNLYTILSTLGTNTLSFTTDNVYLPMNTSTDEAFITSDDDIFSTLDPSLIYIMPDSITVQGSGYTYNRISDNECKVILSNIGKNVLLTIHAQEISKGDHILTSNDERLESLDGYLLEHAGVE